MTRASDTIVLERGRTRATIAPSLGGRLLQLEARIGDHWTSLLYSPATHTDPLAFGSFPMVPWPNRIDGGRFTWRGRLYEVPTRGQPHALHGVGCYVPWRVERVATTACEMAVDVAPGWPFGGYARQRFEVLPDGISQRIELHATAEAFPAGTGWHPWFRRRIGAHDVRLLVDADRLYHTDGMIPTGWIQPVQGDADLRRDTPLGRRRLDTCYRHPRAIMLSWGNLELSMRSSGNVRHAVVYTPRHAISVEPQTCAIDAFHLEPQGIDAGVHVVTPREPLVATTTWRWCLR